MKLRVVQQVRQVGNIEGGKFAVAGQRIAGASENFVLNY
jgi:hypothetical protein